MVGRDVRRTIPVLEGSDQRGGPRVEVAHQQDLLRQIHFNAAAHHLREGDAVVAGELPQATQVLFSELDLGTDHEQSVMPTCWNVDQVETTTLCRDALDPSEPGAHFLVTGDGALTIGPRP